MGKHLSQEERDEIVRLHLEEGRSTRKLASEFNISRSAILNWIRAARRSRAQIHLARRRKTGAQKEADKLVRELQMQVEVMQAFLHELERWGAPR